MSGPMEKTLLKHLLECSDSQVGSFELVKLSEVANLRREMLALFDRLVDVSAQAVLAAWLRTIDRNELRQQLLEPASTLEVLMSEAKAQIRNQGRSKEEAEDYGEMPSPWLVRPHMTPEEAKQARKASRRSSLERHIAKGKCEKCQEPLDRNSVRYCEKHLALNRDKNTRYRRKKGIPPGRGTPPGTLASLAASRERKAKALLTEGAAITLQSAKESLLAHMPAKAQAMTQAQLFEAAAVPCKTTGQQALNELLAAGKIQRAGKGSIRNLFRYWAQ